MTLTAVLLAGGDSRRMGRDKATIVFRGEPLWQRQIELLRDLQPERIFLSVRREPAWLPIETELLLDEPPFRGPLGGLTKALERMPTSHLVVLAVDMPFMTSEQMRTLWGMATIGCGVLPMIGDRAEPLAAIYPREAGGDLAAALASDDFSLQRLSRSLVQQGRLRVFQVPPEESECYRSVNEPGDFQKRRFETAACWKKNHSRNSLPEFRRCVTWRAARKLRS
jgi:molybdopterin-guanine dinucleotide biosynthesis protein A